MIKKHSFKKTLVAMLIVLATALTLITATSCTQGLSAYEIAVKNGFEGDEAAWLESLKGENGKDGEDGEDGDSIASSPLAALDQKKVNEALLSTVLIYCGFKDTENYTDSESDLLYSAGSGIIYDIDKEQGNAYIITNYHVVYDNEAVEKNKISENIYIYLYGMYFGGTDTAEETGIKAKYLGGSMTYDIAVLKVENNEVVKNSDAREAEFADSSTVCQGMTAIAIGNPQGYGTSVTSGVVSVDSEYISMLAVDDKTSLTMRVIRFDTAVNSGNSGGGLFDSNGKLIGVVNAKKNTNSFMGSTSVENIGYAIPSNIALYITENIIENCDGEENLKAKKCLIGITVSITDSYAEYNEESGIIKLYETVTIKDVTETSIAKGHLMAGDNLVSIKIGDNEYEITRQFVLIDLMLKAKVGDTVTLTADRNGETVSFTAVFTEDNITIVE